MPRPRRFAADQLAEAALPLLWHGGYDPTSIDDLARATGASRHALYHAYPDKKALLLAVADTYRRTIVDPAFAPVEAAGAGLVAIAAYFETQIAAAEAAGLPGPGCLFANLSTEEATRDPAVAAVVRAHLERLRTGFARALGTAGADPKRASDWAALLVATAQGLWSLSRLANDAAALRAAAGAALALIERELRR